MSPHVHVSHTCAHIFHLSFHLSHSTTTTMQPQPPQQLQHSQPAVQHSIPLVSRALVTDVLQTTVADMRAAGVPAEMTHLFYVYMCRAMTMVTTAAAELGRHAAGGARATDVTRPCFDHAFVGMIRAFGMDLVAHAYAPDTSQCMSQCVSQCASESVCMHDSTGAPDESRPCPRRSPRLAAM